MQCKIRHMILILILTDWPIMTINLLCFQLSFILAPHNALSLDFDITSYNLEMLKLLNWFQGGKLYPVEDSHGRQNDVKLGLIIF